MREHTAIAREMLGLDHNEPIDTELWRRLDRVHELIRMSGGAYNMGSGALQSRQVIAMIIEQYERELKQPKIIEVPFGGSDPMTNGA